MKLGEIAKALDGELLGDGSFEVARLASLVSATQHDLSFIVSEKHAPALRCSHVGAMILTADLAHLFDGHRIIVADAYVAYARISAAFEKLLHETPSVHASACVHASAELQDGVYVGANVTIEAGARIGRDTRLMAGCFVGKQSTVGSDCLVHPNAVIYHDVHIGDRVVIQGSAVLGSDGFGFACDQGRWTRIHQLGRVIVGNDVEIGAGTCIDRGALDDTEIGDNVIIDNLVHIAHNVRIGSGTAIAGCVGIAGSTTIGERCAIAGAVSINGHIDIAERTRINGGSVITKSTQAGQVYASGTRMQEVAAWRKSAARHSRLDELHKRVVALERAGRS